MRTENLLNIDTQKTAVVMKNIISKSDVIQNNIKFEYDQNLHSTVEQKKQKRAPYKLIKGKVKVYSNTTKTKIMNRHYVDDESEFNIISERMLLFLKFSSLFIVLIALFIMYKRYI